MPHQTDNYSAREAYLPYAFTLCLVLLAAQTVFPQGATIRGRVQGRSGEVPPTLKVVLVDKTTKTRRLANKIDKAKGEFEIRHVKKGTYLLAACSSTNYLPTNQVFEVGDSDPSRITLTLTDADPKLKRNLKGTLWEGKKKLKNYEALALAYDCEVMTVKTDQDANYKFEGLPIPPRAYKVAARHPVVGQEKSVEVSLDKENNTYQIAFETTPDGESHLIASIIDVPLVGPTPGGFVLTVRQVPNLNLALQRAALVASPGQTMQLPLTVTNTGNKEDQFRLETDLPAEYRPTFSLSSGGQDAGLPILVTPQLARNQNLEVILNIRVPETALDGQQRSFNVRAASLSDFTVARVGDASVNVVAPALAAASNASREKVMPGDTFTQRITLRNQGSASARDARADFVFSPDFEFVSATPTPINYDRPSRTASWSLGDLKERDNREIIVTLRAVPGALATNGSMTGSGTMRTSSLPTPSNFDGPAIAVGQVARAQVDAVSAGLTVTPGDIVYIPFVVRNPSNYPEGFEIQVVAPGAPVVTIYADTNGDGQHQESEPAITQTTTLDPRGGQYPVLLRADIPRSTPDRKQFTYNFVTRALKANARVVAEGTTVLNVAAPRARVRVEQATSEVQPGDTISYRMVLVNEGSGLAKNLTVTESLPEGLELVATEPQLDASGNTNRFVWRVAELAPGDTATLLVKVRLKADLPADASVAPRHTLTYQDTNANSYTNQ